MRLKKLPSVVFVMIMVLSLFSVPTEAARLGDIMGYAQPTDIVATINGYQIKSFNVNGYTYIISEDLRYYGFNVNYYWDQRAITIYRDYSATSPRLSSAGRELVNPLSMGETRPLLYTDIVTYVNDNLVTSYNIDGQTIIRFDELSRFGTVSYDNNKREISLLVDGMSYNPMASFAEGFGDEFSQQMRAVFQQQFNLNVSATIKCRASSFIYDVIIENKVLTSVEKAGMQNGMDQGDTSSYYQLKESFPELKSCIINVYDASGALCARRIINV